MAANACCWPSTKANASAWLSERLLLVIGAAGICIEQGRPDNRTPGILQFRSARIHALARANPAMQLLANALGDLHFSWLSSDLGYDEKGRINMSLRLEGRNPDLEKNRPIHLNIDLEENIPALL